MPVTGQWAEASTAPAASLARPPGTQRDRQKNGTPRIGQGGYAHRLRPVESTCHQYHDPYPPIGTPAMGLFEAQAAPGAVTNVAGRVRALFRRYAAACGSRPLPPRDDTLITVQL